MKFKILSIISIFSFINLHSQNIYENFENYTPGSLIAETSNGVWVTWLNNPGSEEDTPVSSAVSFGGQNSMLVQQTAAAGGTTDIVLPLGGASSGIWNLSFMMFIEADFGGYFNILHQFIGAQGNNWAFEVYFSQDGTGYIDVDAATQINFEYPNASWFRVQLSIDMESDLIVPSFNGIESQSFTWSNGSAGPSSVLDGLNFYAAAPAGESALYYIDDVRLSESNLNIDKSLETNNNFYIYNETINFKDKSLIGLKYSILNSIGSLIYHGKIIDQKIKLNLSNGIYFLIVETQNGDMITNKFYSN
ncbi:MAG: hypothetical protein CBE48_002810 [Flavobacteriales bacterium TMED288]|nr:hypothetical protein [Flavobacteriales bacterium]RPG53027.1 MAG: hypothetical protein CBE48_002810 [Flavobacteriales bacterium TMED288]|tara:strand:+ start:3458 stop:4372 length:915 start_codon:yes stop_codon:yes gene_type:complete